MIRKAKNTVHYYDSRYNVAQVRTANYPGGIETTCTSYSFTGKPMSVKTISTSAVKGTLEETNSVMNAGLQPYKYNGKEFDRMHGLDTYDYGARQYNPVTGRWDRMDPLCEKYYDVSPYGYCHNNPILLVDLNGTDDCFDEKGMFIERTDTGSNVFVMINGQYVNITEVDFSGNFSIIENIGRHYLAKSDYNDFNLTACSTGGYIPIDAAFSNDTGTEKYYTNLTNGYVNKALGNCYDFECITYHEYTHRYFSFTHGGTIGEAYAIMLTAYACTAWSKASDDYIISQTSYAENSINLYSDNMIFSNFVVKILNHIFNGYASFELNNNKISKTNLLNDSSFYFI